MGLRERIGIEGAFRMRDRAQPGVLDPGRLRGGTELSREWLQSRRPDLAKPFAQVVLAPAHGVMVTSATLCSADADGPDWLGAVARSGANHLEIQLE